MSDHGIGFSLSDGWDVNVMILLSGALASASGAIPENSAGYSIAPTPTIVPWPAISRGTEWLVPIVPVGPPRAQAYARGLRPPDSYQHTLIALAINDHFTDQGEDHPVRYQDIPLLP